LKRAMAFLGRFEREEAPLPEKEGPQPGQGTIAIEGIPMGAI